MCTVVNAEGLAYWDVISEYITLPCLRATRTSKRFQYLGDLLQSSSPHYIKIYSINSFNIKYSNTNKSIVLETLSPQINSQVRNPCWKFN